MSPEMQKSLEAFFMTLLDGAQKWGEKGIDFATQQIPLIIQEKLHFDAGIAIMWLVFAIIVFCVSLWIGRRFQKESEGVSWAIISLPAGVSVITFMVNVHTLLNIWLAPRLYIIDWLKTMVTGAPK